MLAFAWLQVSMATSFFSTKNLMGLAAGLPLVLGCTSVILGCGPANASQVLGSIITYSWTGQELIQGANRLSRNGSPSVAGMQKAFPGTIADGPVYFYLQDFQALPSSLITLTANAANSLDSFTSIYSGDTLFDPANLDIGYLGDAGRSGNNWSFQVDTISSGNLRFVGNSVRGNSAIGEILDVTVTYSPYTPNLPVPGPLPLLGATTAFSFSRKLKKRCKDRDILSS